MNNAKRRQTIKRRQAAAGRVDVEKQPPAKKATRKKATRKKATRKKVTRKRS